MERGCSDLGDCDCSAVPADTERSPGLDLLPEECRVSPPHTHQAAAGLPSGLVVTWPL